MSQLGCVADYEMSAGIACNKLLAKIGSAMNKPNQQTVIPTRRVLHQRLLGRLAPFQTLLLTKLGPLPVKLCKSLSLVAVPDLQLNCMLMYMRDMGQ